MDRKAIARAFLEQAAAGKVDEAYEHVARDFIHHNQYFPGDRESLERAMKEASETTPNRSFDIKRIWEDGDTVITLSHVVTDEMEIAVIHALRFEGEEIVEAWDLGQVLDPDSPNENGPF